MDYVTFKGILDEKIIEGSKAKLFESLSTHPERYVGVFRLTTPKNKIIQNLSQSYEIKFGDAFEIIIEKYLVEYGFEILPHRISDGEDNLDVDHLFTRGAQIFVIEQKMRDDHDSTKMRGQMLNFEKKLLATRSNHANKDLLGLFYFIDDSFHKNKKFYGEQIDKFTGEHGMQIYLCYGAELFAKLEMDDCWQELLGHLAVWKDEIMGQHNAYKINFDEDPDESFKELTTYLKPTTLLKFFENNDLEKYLPELFPEGTTIELIKDWSERNEIEDSRPGMRIKYRDLSTACKIALEHIKN